MAYYVINHKVENFDVWKKVYDGFEETRKKFNVKEHYALRSAADANHVLVVGEGDSAAIERFLKSDELKNGMANAGIDGKPEIFVGDNIG